MDNPYTNPDEPGFNPAYRGTPPWDIGRPQPDFVRLEEAGEIQGSVLDVGCGTGEHVLYLASRGHDAWGVDLAPLAIDIARRKSAERNIQATFIVADVFDLGTLGRTFDTVVDSGLLHIFSPEQRPGFLASLAEVLDGEGPHGRRNRLLSLTGFWCVSLHLMRVWHHRLHVASQAPGLQNLKPVTPHGQV